jgi:hypothetical protein
MAFSKLRTTAQKTFYIFNLRFHPHMAMLGAQAYRNLPKRKALRRHLRGAKVQLFVVDCEY